jgi:thioredoxin reductase (NADPH)
MNGMIRPVFLVVDDDHEAVTALTRAPERRLGADYQIIAAGSPEQGLSALERLRERGEQVAVMIADQWMPRMTGDEFLLKAHQIYPLARRALIAYAFDRRAEESIFRAMALGRADALLVKPWDPADHYLYPPIGALLDDWVQVTDHPGVCAMHIVAQPRAPRTYELRDLLYRNGVPFECFQPDSPEGRQLLEHAGQDGERLPVVVYFNGRVQVDPPTGRLSTAWRDVRILALCTTT